MPRFWPGYLAVWTAVILHLVWVGLLLVPSSHAYDATPLHQVYSLAGYSTWRTVALLGGVAFAALFGLMRKHAPGQKIVFLLPQQLVLGVSAAGAVIAVLHSHYSDGVSRPATFIAADQLAVILTWLAHTCALMFLYLIHVRKLRFDGGSLPGPP